MEDVFDYADYVPPIYGICTKDKIKITTSDIVERLNMLSIRKPLADKTVQSYKEWLSPFVSFCVAFKLILEDRNSCIKYITTLIEKKRDRTYVLNVRLLLQKVFSFFPKLPTIRAKLLREAIRGVSERVMSKPRIKAILAYVRSNRSCSAGSFQEIADFIQLMYNTGLRPNEVLSLTPKHIQELEMSGKTTIIGKGSKERVVFGSNTANNREFYHCVRTRANVYGLTGTIFNLSQRTYRRQFHDLQKDILLLPAPFHALHSIRRAAALRVYESNNKDIGTVKRFLGHSSFKTTELYLDVADDDIVHSLNHIEDENNQ
jgi:site-specific recombinase XerD